MTCGRLQHRMPLRAWRFTAPTSRTQPSVGKSTSRPLLRSLPASVRSAPPKNGSSSSEMIRSSASRTGSHCSAWPPSNGRPRPVCRHRPSPRRRRTRARHATAAPTHRARPLASLRRHHPAIGSIDPPGYLGRDLPGTAGQDDRLSRPCPPPRLAGR